MNTEVLTVSVDSPFVHKVWDENELSKMAKGGIPFPMLSDPAGQIGKMYSVYDEQNAIDLRGSFIIDPNGVLQGYEVMAAGVGRNTNEMIRKIMAFQHHLKTGEAMPADWKEGEKTLNPTPENTGKIWEQWKPTQ